MNKFYIFAIALLGMATIAQKSAAQEYYVVKNDRVVYVSNSVDYIAFSEDDLMYYPAYQGYDPQPIDLGLSVMWASHNVGAKNSCDNGDFFAWGETRPHYLTQNGPMWRKGQEGGYSPYYYDFYDRKTYEMTKYNKADGKTELDAEDDAATATWGNGWRIPTIEEFQELQNDCVWEYTDGYSDTSVAGYIIFKKLEDAEHSYNIEEDVHIFLPLNNQYNGDRHLNVSYGNYWARTLRPNPTYNPEDAESEPYIYDEADFVAISKNNIWLPAFYTNDRYFGRGIRAVKAK